MRHIIDALIIGSVIAWMAMLPGAPAGGSGHQQGGPSQSLQIGLGVRVDSDWISLHGTWSTSSRPDGGESGAIREVPIGAVPNVLGRVRKGAALVRAIRCTTLCVAKQWLKDRQANEYPRV